jgi:hypothetical protein
MRIRSAGCEWNRLAESRSVVPSLAQPIDNRLELSLCEPQDGIEIGFYPRCAVLESSDHGVAFDRGEWDAGIMLVDCSKNF